MKSNNTMQFKIFRYNPEVDQKPYVQEYTLDNVTPDMMLLDALNQLKEQDPTLGFRRSCGEGVCGSDGMNINGVNGLACITSLMDLNTPVEINPLPGLPVIRDLIIDMEQFYKQYRAVKPYLTRIEPLPEAEIKQSPEDRDKLDGLYECVLCACCSTSCPSFWWNPDKFLGPAALLQAGRFLQDSRDQMQEERLEALDGPFKLFRCHTIMNCVQVCPKDLNPTKAIGEIKKMMVKKTI